MFQSPRESVHYYCYVYELVIHTGEQFERSCVFLNIQTIQCSVYQI